LLISFISVELNNLKNKLILFEIFNKGLNENKTLCLIGNARFTHTI